MSYQFVIVDDSSVNLDIIEVLLEQLDISAIRFSDPVFALEFMKKNPPDAFLTDYMMPNMNGLELITEIKKHHPALKCAVITGLREESQEIREKAFQLGALYFLTYPIGFHDFQNAIKTLIGDENPTLYCKNAKYTCINRDKVVTQGSYLCCLDEVEEEREIIVDAIDAIDDLYINFHHIKSCSSKLSYAADIINANNNLDTQATLTLMKKFSYILQDFSQTISERSDVQPLVIAFSTTLKNWLGHTYITHNNLFDVSNFIDSLQSDFTTLEMALGICIIDPNINDNIDDFFF